jgi:hypothetical protein
MDFMNKFNLLLIILLSLAPAVLFSAAVEYNDNGDGTSYITMTFMDPEDPAYNDLTGVHTIRVEPNIEFEGIEAAYFDVKLDIVQSNDGTLNFNSISIDIYDSVDILVDTVLVDQDRATSGGVVKKNGQVSFAFSGNDISLQQGEYVEYNLNFKGKFKKSARRTKS